MTNQTYNKTILQNNSVYLTILIILFYIAGKSQCVSSGPNNGSVFVNDVSAGTVAWTTPSNSQTSDNVRSTASAVVGAFSTVKTNYLISSGYGFSIPLSATICGIEAHLERRQQGVVLGSSVNDNSLKIVKGGVILGSDHASGVNWTSSDLVVTYGNNSDLWGTTWTPTDVNASDFGVASISAQLNTGLASLFLSAEIDNITVTVYYYENILPIELVSFEANCQNNNIKIDWKTASEINNDFFTIEKSTDAINWKNINTMNGAGTSSSQHTYHFQDNNSLKGILYYRLKQTDFNGKTKTLNTVDVNCDNNIIPILNVFPNPLNNVLNIDIKNCGENETFFFQIFNSAGSLIKEQNFLYENNISKSINLDGISNGLYLIKIKGDNVDYTAKILKE